MAGCPENRPASGKGLLNCRKRLACLLTLGIRRVVISISNGRNGLYQCQDAELSRPAGGGGVTLLLYFIMLLFCFILFSFSLLVFFFIFCVCVLCFASTGLFLSCVSV